LGASGTPRLYLLDEASDLFSGGKRPDPRPRAFFPPLVGKGPLPPVLTPKQFFRLRRAPLPASPLFPPEVRPPEPLAAHTWEKILAEHGISTQPADAKRLARLVLASPGVIESVVSSARASGGGIDRIERSLLGIAKVMDPDVVPRTDQRVGPDFDPALSNADR